MSITQTVEIPINHRLTIDVPHEVPAGPVILTFTPARTYNEPQASFPRTSVKNKDPATIEEALQMAEEKACALNRKPISRFFGTLSPNTYGDGVAYQRAIRDEWD